jgi:hypothetical protein
MDRDLRRLIIVAVALLVVLFTGRAVISALYDEEQAMRSSLGMLRKLRSGGEADSRPDRAAMSELAALREELREELDARLPELAYELPPEFDVPAGQSPDLRYIEVVRREQELLVKGGAYVGRSVPSNLGLPDLNPTGLEDVLRTLRSLHIVHVVVLAGLESGVGAFDEIEMPTVGRRRRAESGFVRTHRVEFEVRGEPRAIRDMLAAIAGGRPYLAVDDVRIESLDEDGTRVTCRFAAAALLIDPEQPVLAGPRG